MYTDPVPPVVRMYIINISLTQSSPNANTGRDCRLQYEQTQALLPPIGRQNNWCWLPIGWRVSHLYRVDRVGGDIPALIIQLYVKTEVNQVN